MFFLLTSRRRAKKWKSRRECCACSLLHRVKRAFLTWVWLSGVFEFRCGEKITAFFLLAPNWYWAFPSIMHCRQQTTVALAIPVTWSLIEIEFLKSYYNCCRYFSDNLQWFRPAVPNLFGTRDWFCGRQFFRGWEGMVQAVVQVTGSGRWSFACLLATHLLWGLVPNRNPGVGDPCCRHWLILSLC